MALSDTLKLIITADASSASAQFKKLGTDAEKSMSQAQGASGKFQSVMANAGPLLATAGAAVVAFGKSSVDAFMDAGTESLKLQRYLGGTAEEASSLRFAAKQTGIDVDALAKGMGILSKNLEGQPELFKQFGITTEDAGGKTLSFHEILLNTAEDFKQLPNGAEKTAQALKLFGRSGAELLPFLNRGREGIEALEAKTGEYGQLLSGKNLQDTKKAKQAQRELAAAFDGLKVTIGKELVPQLTKMTEDLTNMVKPLSTVVGWWTSFNDALLGVPGWVLSGGPLNPVATIDVFNNILGIGDKASIDFKKVADATGVSEQAVKDWIDTQKKAGIEYNNTEEALKAYRIRVQDVDVATGEANEETASWSDTVADANKQLQDAQKELDNATKKIKDYFGAISGNLDTEAAYQEAVDNLTGAIKENGVTLDVNTDAGRKNLKALEDTRDAILDKALAHAKETGNVKTAIDDTNLYVISLEKQLRQSGFSKKAAEDYINQLGLTPENIETAFIQSGLQTGMNDVANFSAQLDALDGRVIRVGVGILTVFANSIEDLKTQISIKGGGAFRAQGGPVHRGESYIVGDRRGLDTAEVFTPNTDGVISPDGSTWDGGGNSMPLQATIVIDGKPFAQVMTTAQRTDARGRRWAHSQ